MRKPGSAADLVPLLTVAEDYFLTTGGRLGRILACGGLNLAIASDETADACAARFAAALTFLPADARLQLLAINRPLRAEDWVPRHLAQYRPPAELAGYRDLLGRAYARVLGDQTIPDLRFYAVLSLPGAPSLRGHRARQLRGRRLLARSKLRHQQALHSLELATNGLVQSLTELGVQASPLDQQATIDLLWRCANPDWSQDATAPRAAYPGDLRSLREQLAQSRLTRLHDMVRLDWGYETTISLRALPEATFPGWLESLTASGVTFRFALHILPLPKTQERTALTRRLRQRHGVVRERQVRDLPPDIEQELAYDEVRDLLTEMSAGDLRTFRTAIFVTVRAATPEALKAAIGKVVRALGDAGGTSLDRCHLWQLPAWGATLPLAENPAGMTYRTITSNLADTLPFLRHGAGTTRGPLIGFAEPGHEVVTLDMFDPALPNGNLIVCGMSGSGKTLFAQAYALKHLALGGRVIVLDRSTDHWADLVAAVGDAELHHVRLDSGFRLNPWQLPVGAHEPGQAKVQYLLDLHQLLLGEQREGGSQLTTTESALLEAACRAVYQHSAEPHERDLYSWLRDQAQSAQDIERRRRYAALAERLVPYVEDGTYAGLLDGPTTVRSEALLTVFNFRGLSDRLVPLVMLPLIEHIWQVIADPTKPILLILDEGWKLLEHPASARFLTEVARTGRHHGIVSLNLSQFVTDYTGPTGSAVLDNAAVALLLKQHPKLLPQAQQIFGLSGDERQALAQLATVKGVHAAAYLHAEEGADSGVVRLWVTPEEYWLCTSHPPERQLRQTAIARHGGNIWAAVRELAAMTPDQRETLHALATEPAHGAALGAARQRATLSLVDS